MNNSGGDATGASLYFIRKSYDATWVHDTTSVKELARLDGGGSASSVSFQSNNNKLEYKVSNAGNGTFYAIEFDK